MPVAGLEHRATPKQTITFGGELDTSGLSPKGTGTLSEGASVGWVYQEASGDFQPSALAVSWPGSEEPVAFWPNADGTRIHTSAGWVFAKAP